MPIAVLENLFAKLTPAQAAEFQRQQIKDLNSKEAQIFSLLKSSVHRTPAQIAVKIYGSEQMNALSSLRKRILHKLEEYIVLLRTEQSARKKDEPLAHFQVAQFCIDHALWELAMRYLSAAETSAKKHNRFDILTYIYKVQLEHARQLETDIPAVTTAWEEVIRRQDTFRRLAAATATVQQQLDRARESGEILDLQAIKREVIGKFHLDAEEKTNAEFMHQLAVLVRNALVSTKDYYLIEEFAGRIIKRLQDGNAFHEGNTRLQIELLFMHAQACYRNCRFDRAEQLLVEAERLIPAKQSRSHSYFLKIASLRAAIYGYTHRVSEAIALLRAELESENAAREHRERANMWLNLAMCEFISGEHRNAIRTIQKINTNHTQPWLRKNLGQEWVFKKELVEVVLLYDGGQDGVAENKLDQLFVRYKDFLKGEIYSRGYIFMKFVRAFFRDPDIVRTPQFHEEVKAAALNRREREDIHAITFFCWLKSKMTGRPFYDVIQERIEEQKQYHRA
ncbi:MAG: hypothetical protein ACK500_13870 [Flavobacteriales bacterium]|jgi:tetratricopeptide (TPR) repeat protein